jgi:hypothetical protein
MARGGIPVSGGQAAYDELSEQLAVTSERLRSVRRDLDRVISDLRGLREDLDDALGRIRQLEEHFPANPDGEPDDESWRSTLADYHVASGGADYDEDES